jgi:hypothetical protein
MGRAPARRGGPAGGAGGGGGGAVPPGGPRPPPGDRNSTHEQGHEHDRGDCETCQLVGHRVLLVGYALTVGGPRECAVSP